jgi:hypothetical protein
VASSPRVPVLEPDPVPQKQLAQPMPATHQIDPDRFSGANQIAQRLLLAARHADRMQLARQQQPRSKPTRLLAFAMAGSCSEIPSTAAVGI